MCVCVCVRETHCVHAGLLLCDLVCGEAGSGAGLDGGDWSNWFG